MLNLISCLETHPIKPLKKQIRKHDDIDVLTDLYNHIQKVKQFVWPNGKFGHLSFSELETLQTTIDRHQERLRSQKTKEFKQNMALLMAGQPIPGEQNVTQKACSHKTESPKSGAKEKTKRRRRRRFED